MEALAFGMLRNVPARTDAAAAVIRASCHYMSPMLWVFGFFGDILFVCVFLSNSGSGRTGTFLDERILPTRQTWAYSSAPRLVK